MTWIKFLNEHFLAIWEGKEQRISKSCWKDTERRIPAGFKIEGMKERPCVKSMFDNIVALAKGDILYCVHPGTEGYLISNAFYTVDNTFSRAGTLIYISLQEDEHKHKIYFPAHLFKLCVCQKHTMKKEEQDSYLVRFVPLTLDNIKMNMVVFPRSGPNGKGGPVFQQVEKVRTWTVSEENKLLRVELHMHQISFPPKLLLVPVPVPMLVQAHPEEG